MTLDLAMITDGLALLGTAIGPYPVWQIIALSVASAAGVEIVKLGAQVVEASAACEGCPRLIVAAGAAFARWRVSRIYASTLRAIACLVGGVLGIGLWGVAVEPLVVGLGAGASAEVVYRYLIKPAERLAGKEAS